MDLTDLQSMSHERLIGAQVRALRMVRLTFSRLEDLPCESRTVGLLKSRLNELQNIMKEVIARDDEIGTRALLEDEPYILDGTFEQFQIIYEQTHERIHKLLEEVHPEEGSVPTQAASGRSPRSPAGRAAKLPRIEVPTFSGHAADWDTYSVLFKDFLTRIHNASWTDRLHYLAASLKEGAPDLVKHLKMEEGEFERLWRRLESRYLIPADVLNNIGHAFESVRSVKRDSAVSLRNMADDIRSAITFARSKGFVLYDCANLLSVYRYVSRLDQATRAEWETVISRRSEKIAEREGPDSPMNFPAHCPSLEEFVKFLEARANVVGRITGTSSRTSSPTRARQPSWPTKGHPIARRALYTGKGESCPICREPHAIASCPQFQEMSARQRYERVKSLRLCYNCFGQHLVRLCNSRNTCRECKRWHHTLIHHSEIDRPLEVAGNVPTETRATVAELSEKVRVNL